MSDAIAKATNPGPSTIQPPEHALFKKLLDKAKKDRQTHQAWLQDVYRFSMPWRTRFNSTTQNHDQDELFDTTAVEALTDFAADMQSTFTPLDKDWLEIAPIRQMSPSDKAQIKDQLRIRNEIIFDEIRRSNFNEAAQECYPDLGHGTMGMLIQDISSTRPIHCEAIPTPELLITRGLYGGVGATFRETKVMYRDLRTMWPDVQWPHTVASKAASLSTEECTVTDGIYRDWEDISKDRFVYCVMHGQTVCSVKELEGDGSSPFVVARWRTDRTTAWGVGPLYVTLPKVKTLDQLVYLILKALNKNVDPVLAYDDDGVINLDLGILPGSTIARQAGSKIDVIESSADFQTAFFERDAMAQEIKRSLYQDKPYQRGDTPPSASQWMDETAQLAKRMGAPIGRLVNEWQVPVVKRFSHLLEKRGVLQPVTLNSEVILLKGESPLVKQQRQDDVVVADRVLEILLTRFGENVVNIVVDTEETARNMVETLGAYLIKLRSTAEIGKLATNAAAALTAGGVGPATGPTVPSSVPSPNGAPPAQ